MAGGRKDEMENEDDKAGGSVGKWEHFGGSGKQKNTRPLSRVHAPVRIVCVGGCVRLRGVSQELQMCGKRERHGSGGVVPLLALGRKRAWFGVGRQGGAWQLFGVGKIVKLGSPGAFGGR